MIKIIILCILLMIPGCTIPQYYDEEDLIIATTTSMQDSGLLSMIIPIFNERYNVEVKVVAVGTGAGVGVATTTTTFGSPQAARKSAIATSAAVRNIRIFMNYQHP